MILLQKDNSFVPFQSGPFAASLAMMEAGRLVDRKSRPTGLGLFARSFLKEPAMLGWFLPSSRYLIDNMLKRIDWERARVIVEYGPGVGNITGEILKRMRPDARLLVLEINCDFIDFLRRSFTDPRLIVMQESADQVDQVLNRLNLQAVDYVISGIPFSLLPHEVRLSIIGKTRAVLRSDGAFLVYQFSSAVLPHLQRTFGKVHHHFELRNLLPARLYYCIP